MDAKTFRTVLGASELVVELTPLAEQANGHVLIRYGETTVLVTAVMSRREREGGDFFPLTVDYEEKFYAAGKILGSRFVKRENRPSEEAILTARLIDRTIRPRFDMRMRNEVQVVATVLSFDGENDADVPSILGASLALSLSDIPWGGPVAGVRIGRGDTDWRVNPSFTERDANALDVIVAGTADKINMIEAGANDVPEEAVAEAIARGHEEIKKLITFQEDIIARVRPAKTTVRLFAVTGAVRESLVKNFSRRLEGGLWSTAKAVRNANLAALAAEWHEYAQKEFPTATPAELDYLWEDEIDTIVHRLVLKDGARPDGRKLDELRPLHAEVEILPRVHGSGLFIRGETQALSTVTLGGPGDEQIVEGMEGQAKRRFMHHYNFPPFSTGETKPMRGPGRREIGHGALAERAIAPMIPPKAEFPYTIRIVSEILSSNGSSSMASVCGSTLALSDAGVPIKKPVAGIAMGLMMESASNYRILTDIQGPEDHYGDMDFKAAGTTDGITALQMDVKIDGVTVAMLVETMAQAKRARRQILETIANAIPAPRPNLKPHAPRITIMKIDPEKIGALIGPGGKMINSIIAASGADVDIEDDGSVFITTANEEAMTQALALIREVVREFKPGELIEGTVSRIFGFGAMVEIGPKQEGLIHISELAPWHVNEVEDIVHVGDQIRVMVRNVDEQGRLNLSLKSVPGRYTEEDIAKAEAAGAMNPRPERAGYGFDHPSSRRPGPGGGHHGRRSRF